MHGHATDAHQLPATAVISSSISLFLFLISPLLSHPWACFAILSCFSIFYSYLHFVLLTTVVYIASVLILLAAHGVY